MGSEAAVRESQLLVDARSGDPRAVERLLRTYAPAIRRLCARMASPNDDRRDLEEVFQDTLLALSASLSSFRGESSLLTWAYTLARTQWNRRRRRKRYSWHQDTLRTDFNVVATFLVDPASLPEDEIANERLRAEIALALDHLSELDRQVLLLRDLEGYSAPEAAAKTGLTVPAVKTRLHRARRRVRAYLDPTWDPRSAPMARDVPAAA